MSVLYEFYLVNHHYLPTVRRFLPYSTLWFRLFKSPITWFEAPLSTYQFGFTTTYREAMKVDGYVLFWFGVVPA